MKKIAYLAPSEEKLVRIRNLLSEYQHELVFAVGSLAEGVATAKKLINQGIEVIIARGETAYNIRDAYPEIAVVDVPISGFDLALALEKARMYGDKIAVVSFASMIRQVECLESALGVEIRKYSPESSSDMNLMLERAVSEGASVILGGYSTFQAAKQQGIMAVEIFTGDQAYLETFYSARSILATIARERRKTGMIEAVLNNAYEGILSIDEYGSIRSINPVAKRTLKLKTSDIIGRPVNTVWPELELEQVINSGCRITNQFYTVHNVQIWCNKAPIKDHNGTVIGAVATFQETSKIQKVESHIRKQFYAKGHVAHYKFTDIITNDQATKQLVEMAQNYAQSDANILITGETGVGKEVFAQSIHNAGQRAAGPFVAVNCAALPAQLLESELFGYVGGAFTGANREGKLGLFEVAHTGTIFLDEIGEMDYVNQGRLLRVLQERAIIRLGSERIIPINVRIMAATNKNLRKLITAGEFREDLYYRINVLNLRLLPLRHRRKDIVAYAELMLAKIGVKYNRKVYLSGGAKKILEHYTWPGNIRELNNVMERSVAIMGRRNMISASFIERLLNGNDSNCESEFKSPEAEIIRQALKECNGQIGATAKQLSISRVTLWRRMRELNINKNLH